MLDFAHFILQLLIAGFIIRRAEVWFLNRDPNSQWGKALAFTY